MFPRSHFNVISLAEKEIPFGRAEAMRIHLRGEGFEESKEEKRKEGREENSSQLALKICTGVPHSSFPPGPGSPPGTEKRRKTDVRKTPARLMSKGEP